MPKESLNISRTKQVLSTEDEKWGTPISSTATLVNEVFALNHVPIFAAHPGRNRALEILWLGIYWPGIRRDVETCVQNCFECLCSKPRHEFKAPLGEGLVPTLHLEVTTMDICAPIPLTGNKTGILIFSGHLTTYAEAVTISQMTAEECVWAYATHIIARHGSEKKTVISSWQKLRISMAETSHQHSYGIFERFHKSLCLGLALCEHMLE
jgi:hypothetical protein